MEAHELPMLKEVFTELRSGRHIGIEDGSLYAALASHKEQYQALYTGLGLTLIFHDHGFFYLDDETAPKGASRMALFTAILVEYLDDQGVNLEEELTHVILDPAKFPHLKHEKYVRAIGEVGVITNDHLMKVAKSMERYGLLTTREDGTMRFRTSAYRLLDILELAGRSAPEPGASEEEAATNEGVN